MLSRLAPSFQFDPCSLSVLAPRDTIYCSIDPIHSCSTFHHLNPPSLQYTRSTLHYLHAPFVPIYTCSTLHHLNAPSFQYTYAPYTIICLEALSNIYIYIYTYMICKKITSYILCLVPACRRIRSLNSELIVHLLYNLITLYGISKFVKY